MLLANAHAVRQRPGRKNSIKPMRAGWPRSSPWADRTELYPPPAIRALRDLTRTRVALVETRTQAKNRVSKILEDTNIKVAHVVSDVFGASGRRRLAALLAGERDPQKLAARA